MRRGAVALACLAQFVVVLDVSIVNVALPSMRTALGFDAVGVQWVVTAYTLAFAGFLLLGGRLADIYGLRRTVLAALALFAGAGLVGGLATDAATLVAARAAQGLAAAVLAPASLTILTTTFPAGPRRTRTIATWAAVAVAGGAAGNLLSGVLTEYLSWRWVLLVNVPIGAAAALLGRTQPAGPTRHARAPTRRPRRGGRDRRPRLAHRRHRRHRVARLGRSGGPDRVRGRRGGGGDITGGRDPVRPVAAGPAAPVRLARGRPWQRRGRADRDLPDADVVLPGLHDAGRAGLHRGPGRARFPAAR